MWIVWLLLALLAVYVYVVLSIGWKFYRFSVYPEGTDRVMRPKLLPKNPTPLEIRQSEGEAAFKQEAYESHDLMVNGLRLRAYSLRQPAGTPCKVPGVGEATVLLLHGWQDRAAVRMADALDYYRQGFSVFLPDLRTHGDSEGRYIDLGCVHRDELKEWIRYYDERYYPEGPNYSLIWDGVSMGAATVMSLSGDADLPKQSLAVVANSGYSSIAEQVLYVNRNLIWPVRIPALLFSNFLAEKNAGWGRKSPTARDQVQKSQVPLLIIHGTKDVFVPYRMGYDLYQHSAASIKEFWPVAGAQHGDASLLAGPEHFVQRIMDFIGWAKRGEGPSPFVWTEEEKALIAKAKKEATG